MTTYGAEAWERLGRLLIAARAALGYGGRKRLKFARDRGVSDRLIADIELARRQNFDGATLAHLEVVYELQPGTITRVLEGGESAAAKGADSQQREVKTLSVTVPNSKAVVLIPVDEEMTESEREELREWGIQMAQFLRNRRTQQEN